MQKYIATTLSGLEDVLCAELTEIGATDITPSRRAVTFYGDINMLYRANLWLRTAIKVLLPLHNGTLNVAGDIYSLAKSVAWENYFTEKDTFAVEGAVHSAFFPHTGFPMLKVKDAIVDRIREYYGARPDVDRDKPNFKVNVHIDENRVDLSLDSSGEPLYRRGYRQAQDKAPLSEVLAAGLLALAGWKGDTALVDPMCGSGTIVLEGALIASRIPPGFGREFAFTRFKTFQQRRWNMLLEEAKAKQRKATVPLLGGDISEKAIKAAKFNLAKIGLLEDVQFVVSPFQDLTPPARSGTIVTNPPYGERLQDIDVPQLYKDFGDTLKQRWAGYSAWMLSGNKQALKNVGLKPSKKHELRNGDIPCTYARYDLYEGSRKKPKAEALEAIVETDTSQQQ